MDFCSIACKRTWQNRALKRGSQLYRVAMLWRGHKRSHTKGARNPPNPHFGAMTQMLDEWRREDEAMRKVSDAAQKAATAAQRDRAGAEA
jgi:hypothetical protein